MTMIETKEIFRCVGWLVWDWVGRWRWTVDLLIGGTVLALALALVLVVLLERFFILI